MAEDEQDPDIPRFVSLEVTNFLSYKHARFEFADLVALVGPNASGKSNLVAAIKLLRDIPVHGLPIDLARRGGFDQLRHRSQGRPNDPSLRIEFEFPGQSVSVYEMRLGAVGPSSYRVKHETADIHWTAGRFRFRSDGKEVQFENPPYSSAEPTESHFRNFPRPAWSECPVLRWVR